MEIELVAINAAGIKESPNYLHRPHLFPAGQPPFNKYIPISPISSFFSTAMAPPEQDFLSTEIVNRGSMTFSVRVRRRLPDFVQSVNLKYVKLGYHYLISHAVYLATIPAAVLVFGAELGALRREELCQRAWESATAYDLATVVAFLALLVFTLSLYFTSRPPVIYLLDFACYKPADDLKVRTDTFFFIFPFILV